jgi:hypothetical protein
MKRLNLQTWINPSLKGLLAVAVLCILTFGAYQYQPSFTLKFGTGLDRLYFSNAHPLQSKIQGQSYRRIRGVTHFTLPECGSSLRYNFSLRALSSEPKDKPQPLTIYINKKKIAEAGLTSEVSNVYFSFTQGKLKGPFLLFQFVNEGEDDDPPKAIFLEGMTVEPVKTGLFVLPPAGLLLNLSLGLILFTCGAALCHKKAALWTAIIYLFISTLALLFFRWLFLPFNGMLPVIALASLVFISLTKLLLPPVLKKMALNPALIYFQILLVILFVGFALRTIALLYTGTVISDIDFHAHRMGAVFRNGEIFQISTTPDGKYSFPYPTLFYILLVPFKFLTGLPNAVLLKWAMIFVDSLIPILIFIFAMKMMKNDKTGVIAAATYSLFPLAWIKFIYGNCTDIFSILTIWLFLVGFAVSYKSFHLKRKIILSLLLLIPALLSHFSATLFLLLYLPLMVFIAYVAYSNKKNNKRVVSTFLMMIIALAAVFLVYYIHYTGLISAQTVNVLHSSGTSEWRMKEAMLHRFAQVSGSFLENLGIPLFIVFVFSFAAFAERRRRTLGFLIISGLLITAAIYAMASIITPLSIRWTMPLLPAISLIIGWGLERILRIDRIKWIAYVIIFVSFLYALNTIRIVMFDSPYHQLF